MPDVSMPSGSTVTSLGANPVIYAVKAAEYKVVYQTTDTTTPCTAAPSGLAISDSLTLPTEDGWSIFQLLSLSVPTQSQVACTNVSTMWLVTGDLSGQQPRQFATARFPCNLQATH